MSTCVTWELTPVKPLQEACICSAYLTFVNLAGEILTPNRCEFCHWFSRVWIGNPEWQHGTNAHVGHPGKLLLDTLVNFCVNSPTFCSYCVFYLSVTDIQARPTHSINALFLSGHWGLVDWKQLGDSKPLRSSATRDRLVEERDLVHLLATNSHSSQSGFEDSMTTSKLAN